jgi:uncharacterized protein with ATP-grasp and redox domains
MLEQVMERGDFYQEDAAQMILSRFGTKHVYFNDNGNIAISKVVLKEFRRLSEESVVWVRGGRYWRRRQSRDGRGREQEG